MLVFQENIKFPIKYGILYSLKILRIFFKNVLKIVVINERSIVSCGYCDKTIYMSHMVICSWSCAFNNIIFRKQLFPFSC
jgi:hypothetical protein